MALPFAIFYRLGVPEEALGRIPLTLGLGLLWKIKTCFMCGLIHENAPITWHVYVYKSCLSSDDQETN